jgi:hypothetical protein
MRQGSEWELNWRTRLQLGKAGGWPCLGERAFHVESENRRRSVLFRGFGMFGFIFAHFTSNNKGIWKKKCCLKKRK